jgi:hypothetical protein
VRRGLTAALGLGLAASLVAVHVTKGTGAALWPAAIVGVVGMLWRRHSRADVPGYVALVGGAAAIQALWAVLANALGSKATTTVGGYRGGGRIARQGSHEPGCLPRLRMAALSAALPFMTDVHLNYWPAYDVYILEGWAALGWLTVRFPSWVYVVIVVVSFVAGGFASPR